MRKQFVTTVESLLDSNPKTILLMGDIGVFGFSNAMKKYPERVYNIGILEQSMISMASGLSMTGLIPIVHTIAPFITERAFEQLKDDFGYQKLGGNFITVGASYDYAALGCTHHCPADIGILKNIPRMEIVIPGTALEFDQLFRQSYDNGYPTYFRLSETKNTTSYMQTFGKATVIKKGTSATIIAVGSMLQLVIDAASGLDVTILYYTTLSPFDSKTLKENCISNKILLCEPYYSGALSTDIIKALYPRPVIIDYIGIPNKFLTEYGTISDHNKALGFTKEEVERRIVRLMHV